MKLASLGYREVYARLEADEQAERSESVCSHLGPTCPSRAHQPA